MPRIIYKKYRFAEPAILTKQDFEKYKYNYKNTHVNPLSTKFWSDIFGEFRLFIISIIAGVAIVLIGDITRIDWLAGIAGIIVVGLLFSALLSLPSYVCYLLKRNAYFRLLKKRIMSADTYNEFVLEFRK